MSVSNQTTSGAPAGFQHFDNRPNGTFRTMTVGDPSTANFEGSLTIEVWNAGTERRELNVTLTFGRENTTLYRRAVQFPANETLRLQMGHTGRDALTVRSATESSPLTLSRDEFDCNDRTYALRVNRNRVGRSALSQYGTPVLARRLTAQAPPAPSPPLPPSPNGPSTFRRSSSSS